MLTDMQRDNLEAAVNKLRAVLDGTLRDGTGGTDPSPRQVITHLYHAEQDIHVARNWMQDAAFHTTESARHRLRQLRQEIRAERISYGEIAELQGLVAFIDPDDHELLQWAGVPEESTNQTGE